MLQLFMIILIFIITTLASNFLMLAHDKNDHIKIVSFDSYTFNLITLFNISLKSHPLDCVIDNFNNIYFFALQDLSNFTINKFNSSTHELSSFEELIGSLTIRDNIPYVTTVSPDHFHMSQLDWPKLINVFTFESYISLHGVSSYLPSINTFMFYAYADISSIIMMTGDFKISQIYPIHYQVAFIYYHNDTIYTIVYGQSSLRLCSINLSTNCIISYDKRVYSFYSGLLHNNTLYFIAGDYDSKIYYWITTDMSNFTYTVKQLSFSLDIRCIKLL